MLYKLFFTFILWLLFFNAWSQGYDRSTFLDVTDADVKCGASCTEEYFPLLKGKSIALVVNHTSQINGVHLLDTLLNSGLHVKKVFAPEHGFRGEAGAGESCNNGMDTKTGIPIISLYGNKFKPLPADLKGIDVVIFDIQDVGVRFYTYISTLHYVMEACAENNVPLIVLDRPNPNGHYIDGPILKPEFRSFVGMHPIPLVHGLTVGELAGMINGESWLANSKICKLTVVKVRNYTHKMLYQLPINPSPNLTCMAAIYLYPSLGLFEGTCISVARGTAAPFVAFGHPGLSEGTFSFVPMSIPGKAMNPPFEGDTCFGYNVKTFGLEFVKLYGHIYLEWLLGCYQALGDKSNFFIPGFFDKLMGTSSIREMIIAGKSSDDIVNSWHADLMVYRDLRKKYLLYPDFE